MIARGRRTVYHVANDSEGAAHSLESMVATRCRNIVNCPLSLPCNSP